MDNNETKGKGRIAVLKGLLDGEEIRLGYSQSGKVLRYVGPVGPGHLLLIAPARVSLRAALLLPCLLDMPVDNAEICGAWCNDATGYSFED